MRHQPLGNLAAGAVDHVNHPIRDTHRFRQLRHAQQRQRRILARFEDDGAAADQGRRQLPDGNHDGEVPRHDADHHPQRLAAGKRGIFFPGHRRQRHIQRLAGHLPRPAGEVAQKRHRLIQLQHPRQHDGLAGAETFQLRQRFAMLSQGIRQLQQQRTARQRRHLTPLTERLAGALHGAIRLIHFRCRHLSNCLTGGRVNHRERRAVARLTLTGNKLPVWLA